ncbi:MAG: secretin N-terminal domain-containing protein, partial [Candidatus Omnitrophica bacterium]|nr:secretin N-terminal domain-containing protein [Candidatus Omnitrophota bacterium]
FPLKNATVSNSKMVKNLKDQTEDSEDTSSSDSSSSSSSDGGGDEDEDGIKGILLAVKSILTKSGSVIQDARTNSLIVTDIPSQFPVIEKTIAKLDLPVPQILIEIEMLDISKTTGELIGVKIGDSPLSFSGGQRSHLYPWDQNKLLRKGYEFETEYTSGTIDASGLTAVLQFLKTITDTKNLANPKILTLNNQTAEIQISTNEAIGVVTSTGGSEGVVTQNVEAERVQTGIFLSVTPQANLETGEITMAVFPRVIEARRGETYDGIAFRDPEERGTKSVMRVKDGETIYLGGLKKTDGAKTITKVPFLGDLPFIGQAFRHKDNSEEERELVIFITPRIVSDKNYLSQRANQKNINFKREQNYPITKTREMEKALFVAEQQRRKK